MQDEAAVELYMEGGCGVFAIALQRVYGYKLGSYLDDDNIEFWDEDEEPLSSVVHVFAHQGDKIIDVKGIRSVKEMQNDFYIEGRVDWNVSVDEIMNEYSGDDKPLYEISDGDIEEAIEYIRANSERYEIEPSSLKKLLEFLLENDDEDYRGSHRAPGRGWGAPLWDVTGDIYPDDIYTLPINIAARYYGHSEPGDIAMISLIRKYKGKPTARVKIYRAVPNESDINQINPGDWVTIYRPYAVQHGEGPLRGEYKILSASVTAQELFTDGNSIYEWGYNP